MNYRMIARSLGLCMGGIGLCMALPIAVSMIYGENCTPFLWTALIFFALFALSMLVKTPSKEIFAKEGFFIVTVAWILVAAIGALPFVFAKACSYIDALFETISGLSTTGATIFSDVESLSHGLLIWRSFSHWIGGMGVLVLILAVVPMSHGRSMHLARAEMAGPSVSKVVPKMRNTVTFLYITYGVLTFLEFILLICGKMPVFDSLCNAFATAGTGGFATKNIGIGAYDSLYCRWVITVFMLLFGVNFNIYFLVIVKDFKEILKNEELRLYGAIVLLATALISVSLIARGGEVGASISDSAFQVSSIMTTTGFSTVNFDLWPTFPKAILMMLMFTGACAGSTCGGIKLSRFLILYKNAKAHVIRSIHPRSVIQPRLNGKPIDDETISTTSLFFALYIGLIALVFLLISLDGVGGKNDLITSFTAAVSCVSNIGPGFAAVGPMANFGAFSGFSKIVMSFAMLMGRLEIFPLLICLSPRMYSRRTLK